MPKVTVGRENSAYIEIYYEDHGAGQVTVTGAQAVDRSDGEQQPPLALLGPPLAISRERQAAGQVVEGQRLDRAEHASIVTSNATRPPPNKSLAASQVRRAVAVPATATWLVGKLP